MKYDINQVLSEAYESEVSKPTAELNSRVIRQAQVKGRSGKTVKYIRTKLAAAIAVGCCIIGILVGPSVHALAETIFSEWKTTLKFEDGTESIISSDSIFKKIPESAILDDDGGTNTTIGKAQEALGLDLLEHKNVASDEVFYRMELNEDGTLGCVCMWLGDWLHIGENGYVRMSISVLNEGADEKYVRIFKKGWTAEPDKKLVEEYESEKLDSKVVVYTSGEKAEINIGLTAVFIHDGVLYEVNGWNVSVDDMKKVIDEME